MLNSKKRHHFDTPISLVLTQKGAELFLKTNRGYDIFMTLDRKRNYGLKLPGFEFQTLKSLLESQSVCKTELSYNHFSQTGEEIVDITRLYLNYIFHQRFADEVLKIITESRVFDIWLDYRKDDRHSFEIFNKPLSDEFLEKYKIGTMSFEEMQERILEIIRPRIMNEPRWSATEQNIVILSAKKFLGKILNSVWFGLSLMIQTGKTEAYLETIADELWKYLKMLRHCDLLADVVRRITEEQLYLKLKECARNAKETIRLTRENAEEVESQWHFLDTIPENSRQSILWAFDETKVGGTILKRLDIYILLAGENLNSLISCVQRAAGKESPATDYATFCKHYIESVPDAPHACQAAVFLEKTLKAHDVHFSYTFLMSEKKFGVIQLRVQI